MSTTTSKPYDPEHAACVSVLRYETVAQWSDRWRAARVLRGLEADRRGWYGHLTKWILPHLGDLPIELVKPEHLIEFRDWLNHHAGATAPKVWATISTMFRDAYSSNELALRVRKDNPVHGIEGPARGPMRSQTYLYPVELVALADCEGVPQRWRRAITLTCFTGASARELGVLEWVDIDLDAMVIHIGRGSRDARRIPIEPNLRPLLEAMRREAGGIGRVIRMPPAHDLPNGLRKYLALAEVTRAELFANDATHRRITFQDLRMTYITWSHAQGVSLVAIMRRVGRELQSTVRSIREPENLKPSLGAPFPQLPVSLLIYRDEGAAFWAKLRWQQEGRGAA